MPDRPPRSRRQPGGRAGLGRSAAEVLDLLARLRRDYRKTIVMATHDPHAAERASLTFHLEKGAIIEAAPEPRLTSLPATATRS